MLDETKLKLSEKRKAYLDTLTPEQISKSTEIGRAKSIEARVQTFRLRNPSGEEMVITNLKPWCREHPEYALDSSTLIKVAKGKISNHKGWTCKYEDGRPFEMEPPRTKNKLWKIIDPDENVFDDVINLKQFCIEYNLSYGAMKEIGEGKRQNSFRGWTLETKTPDFSGVKTAILEEQKEKRERLAEERRLARLVTTPTGEVRMCIPFPPFETGPDICYIYLLTNILDGKKYVGVSDDPIRRIGEHYRYKKTNKEIIYKGTVSECFAWEDDYILLHDSNVKLGGHGYNQKEGGKGNRQGFTHNEETRMKISAAKKGKPLGAHSEETRLKISNAQKGVPRKKHTPESLAKLSDAAKGRVMTEKHKKNISAARRKEDYVSTDKKRKENISYLTDKHSYIENMKKILKRNRNKNPAN